jgi:hypothetical protein
MEEVLREPVELTESELDVVAGGNPFSANANGAGGEAEVFVNVFSIQAAGTVNNGNGNITFA